jgi:hypothetical protein
MVDSMNWDVFICHASEDKDSVVRPLARELAARDIKVWYDEFTLKLGDSLRQSIDHGLSKSRFGVVILSPAFFQKTWPKQELDALIGKQVGMGKKVVLPVWHNLGRGEVALQTPLLASLIAVSTDRGLNHVAEEIAAVVKEGEADDELFEGPIVTTKDVLVRYVESEFRKLKREEPRSPLELTKEIPHKDNILSLLARVPGISTIPDQIDYLRKSHYVEFYSNSWAEQEAELIGRWMLTGLTSHVDSFKDMYDAGCANFGQYKAIMTMERNIAAPFHYYAQDFNPDWEERFKIRDGKFYLMTLPQVPDITCGLVACTQTLHFLAQHPIAVYTTVLSFNNILTINGLCYITVPEKESQPGMLDLLERAAVDGHFHIIESGRCRLLHRLTNESSQNITTFLYLVLRKENNVDADRWRHLIGTSFFRSGYKEGAEIYGVTNEADIPDYIRLLEMDLQDIFVEQSWSMQTFRHALEVVFGKHALASSKKRREDYEHEIRSSIDTIHKILVDSSRHSADQHRRLSEEAARYLVSLVGWYVVRYPGCGIVEIVHNVCPIVGHVLRTPMDIRVRLHELSSEQIARLIKHLFELCQFTNIDIRKSLDSLVKKY